MSRLAECGYPTAESTGPRMTTSPYLGPLRISVAGSVIEGKTLPCLEIMAANVTIRDSRIVGPCSFGLNVTGGSLTLDHSIVDCANYKGTGIAGSHWTVLASQLLRCENGADVAGGNNTIRDSYIADVREVGGGHGDGIQAYTAGAVLTNVTVDHNTFYLFNPITSSLIMGYPASNLVVTDNYFMAGAYTVYCPNNQPITKVLYRGNRFYQYVKAAAYVDLHRPSFGYTDGCNHSEISWLDNYQDNNLAPVPPA